MREYRRIVLDIFIVLAVFTLILVMLKPTILRHFRGLEDRFIITTVVFGVLNIVLYSREIWTHIRKIIGLKRVRIPSLRLKLSRPRIPRIRLEGGKKLVNFLSKGLISFFDAVRKNRLKFGLWLGGIVLYCLFLAWIYPKFSFDEFMLFVLLLYIPISLNFRFDSRIPIAIALILLVVAAVNLAMGFENYSNRIAIYVCYSLVIGVILMLFEYFRDKND